MMNMVYPGLVLLASFVVLRSATWVGDTLRKRARAPDEDSRVDSGLLLSAILTLLFLVIGFTFSMAVNRYDLRKNGELAEASAIATLYSRADLLPPADGAKVRTLLKRYLDQRLLFYTTRDSGRVESINAETVRLETELWSTIRPALADVPPPLMGLLVSGMNDVANAHRAIQAAWLNRVPFGAWVLMATISIGSCWLIGFRARRSDWLAFLVLPVAVSVSFFLMADLDSPRGGAIRVPPQNLLSVSHQLLEQ
jgi:hypothetical protein